MTDDLEVSVESARRGDRASLEQVLRSVKDLVYGVAIRMFGDPADAQDATQEILLRVARGLEGFRGQSAFRTWVYRVAANHLLTLKKQRAEGMELSFEVLGRELDESVANPMQSTEPLTAVLLEEGKIVCTQAMLLCLDRDHRLAYILGEILELSGEEAAAILELSPAAFRKRLSRARERMEGFAVARCGLVKPENRCRCETQIPRCMAMGLIRPGRLRFATHQVRSEKQKIEQFRSAAELLRSHPDYAAPDQVVAALRDFVSARW